MSAASHPTDYFLNAYFEEGKEEQLSPFLTPQSRDWAKNLTLRSALIACAFLIFAYLFSFLSYSENLVYLCLLAVYLLAGIPSLIESIEDLVDLQVNIDVLMTLAAFGSVAIGSPLEGGLLLVLFAISGAMEDFVSRKAKSSLSSLHKLTPRFANVIDREGIYVEKAISDITPGTQILVKAGQLIPLDGIVLKGTSSVNLVHLTGENVPVPKKPKDAVPAGGTNMEGALEISVTHTSTDSTLARIIQLVTEAQEAKPKLQRWFDTFSAAYAKTIIALAVFFAITLAAFFGLPYLGKEGSIYRALAFLIAASPCALIIALPIAYLSAIGACARKGIVLKGGTILDSLAACEQIAFDKTGTLTTGKMQCLALEPLQDGSIDPLKALDIAFACEQNAHHPIAEAIVNYALSEQRTPAPLEAFRSIPGYGIEAGHQGKRVMIGNLEFIEPLLDPELKNSLQKRIASIREKGETFALLLIEKDLFLFRFSDTLRKGIFQTLEHLRQKGYHLLMLSGDHHESAKQIASLLKINTFFSGLKPEDKLRIIDEESRSRGLAMVGDGVNDAPALARATVGISMGKVGSGAAVEAADVVLLQDNLERLDWLLDKAKSTQSIVKENLIIAIAAIFIASIPALFGLVPLWLAVILHEGGTVIVGLNGLRLLK